MKSKIVLAALVVVWTPSLALAACFGDHAKEDVVMSCADGAVYDRATQTCVPATTG